MTWKLTNYAKTRRALPGVQWRDLSDEEYADLLTTHPGIESQCYFARVEEADETEEAPEAPKVDAAEDAAEETN